MLIVGEREKAEKTVSLRLRTEKDQGAQSLADFIEMAREKIANKELL